jgi:hypothetical protein
MAKMQLRPLAIIRARTAPSGGPLQAVVLTAAARPPAEHVEIKVGNGFRSLAEVAGVLREVAERLESGLRAGGIPADMEEVDE